MFSGKIDIATNILISSAMLSMRLGLRIIKIIQLYRR